MDTTIAAGDDLKDALDASSRTLPTVGAAQLLHDSESIAAQATAATLTTIATFDVAETRRLFLEVVVAAEALTGFAVLGRANASGAFVTLASAAADYTNPNAPIQYASGDLASAAIGTHFVAIDVHALQSVRIQASSALTNATVALEAGAN